MSAPTTDELALAWGRVCEGERGHDESLLDVSHRLLFTAALNRARCIQMDAAHYLGISRRMVYYWKEKYGMMTGSEYRAERRTMLRVSGAGRG